MIELRGFSDAATPVFGDLRVGAPALTDASEALGPFSKAATKSLTTLGDAAEEAGPSIKASDPVVRQTRDLAQDAKPALGELSVMLKTLRKTGGFQRFLEMLYGIGGSVNAYDSLGHFARALIPTQNCFDYVSTVQSGCESRFDLLIENLTRRSASALTQVLDADGNPVDASAEPTEAVEETARDDAKEPLDGEATQPDETEEPVETDEMTSKRSMRDLLDFLVGSKKERGR